MNEVWVNLAQCSAIHFINKNAQVNAEVDTQSLLSKYLRMLEEVTLHKGRDLLWRFINYWWDVSYLESDGVLKESSAMQLRQFLIKNFPSKMHVAANFFDGQHRAFTISTISL